MFKEYSNERIDFIGTNNYILVCCCCSFAKSSPALCNRMDCSTPGSSVLIYLLEFTQIHVRWVGDTIQPSHPLPLSSPFAFNLSQHPGLFQWVGCSSQVAPSIGSFSFSISPSNEYLGLISFRIDWFDLLAVHGTLRSLLLHHCSKASIFQFSAFFMVQLSHPSLAFPCFD